MRCCHRPRIPRADTLHRSGVDDPVVVGPDIQCDREGIQIGVHKGLRVRRWVRNTDLGHLSRTTVRCGLGRTDHLFPTLALLRHINAVGRRLTLLRLKPWAAVRETAVAPSR